MRRVFKRWLVTVHYTWFGEPQVDELVATADMATMLKIWDPFQDSRDRGAA